MPSVQVEQYMLGWDPRNGFAYRIKLTGGVWGPWVMVSSADLAAFAAIFNEQPVYVHSDGSITTGPEPIGN